MKLRYNFMGLGVLLIFTTCCKDNKDMPEQHVNQLHPNLEVELSSPKIEELIGEYQLIEGQKVMFTNKRLWIDTLYQATMVIEKLSQIDFGMYSVQKIKGLSPVGDYDFFRYLKGDFYTLGICDQFKSDSLNQGFYLYNPMVIKKKMNKVLVIQYGSNFRSLSLYRKKNTQSKLHPSLVRSLKNVKKQYTQALKQYHAANKYKRDKLQIEQLFKDSMWVTRHRHKAEKGVFIKTHLYENPHQNKRFTSYDSIFYTKLNTPMKNP